MKKLIAIISAMAIVATAVTAYATDTTTSITVGHSGKPIEMVGTIEPTILSVTMPSSIYFDMSKSFTGDNKVLSPQIRVVNNSNIKLSVSIDSAVVDISGLPNTQWSDDGMVMSNENKIAIGFQNVTAVEARPTTIGNATWISNGINNKKVMDIMPSKTGYAYAVGKMGDAVPEDSNATFSVVPIFVVHK